MRNLQLSVLLCAVAVARCAPQPPSSTSRATPARVEPTAASTDDRIRQQLAAAGDAAASPGTAAELQKLAASINEQHTDLQQSSGDEAKADEVPNAEPSADMPLEDISGRYWYWTSKQKKKPAHQEDEHGDGGLGPDPHDDVLNLANPHDNYDEKPGIIKPIIDKIKEPIIAVLNKPAEIVSHLLNKPHDIIHDRPILDIKKPEEDFLQKPAEIAVELSNNPHDSFQSNVIDHIENSVSSILHSGGQFQHGSEDFIDENPSIIDKIKKPIEALITKPVELASGILKPHKPELVHDRPGIIDNIKKPVSVLLHKPAEIVSPVLNKPYVINGIGESQMNHNFPSKPNIIDHIKKPIDAIFQKPVSLIKPEDFDSVIHFPDDFDNHSPDKPSINNFKPGFFSKPDDKPAEFFGALGNNFNHNPSTGFFSGIHRFQPNVGFESIKTHEYPAITKPYTSVNINPHLTESYQYWSPLWDIPYSAPQPNWPGKPWKLPHSANYGIASGLHVRGLETDSSEEMFGRYAPAYPYGAGQDYFFI